MAGQAPRDAPIYGRWLKESRDRTAESTTWIVTVALAILAGPWAVLGAIFGFQDASSGLFLVVIFGPVMEEVLKVSAPLIVVERRPSFFSSPAQLLICAFMSGLAFAAIENVLYLEVYIPDPEPGIILWRWTACVALHSGCSLIAGFGIARVWRDVWERLDRPRLQLAAPFVVAAAAIHGIYNASATAWTVIQHGGN
jgi:RsiW-degrading membrane proteinase PrsW (M82 family)